MTGEEWLDSAAPVRTSTNSRPPELEPPETADSDGILGLDRGFTAKEPKELYDDVRRHVKLNTSRGSVKTDLSVATAMARN